MAVAFPSNRKSRNGRRKAEPYGGGVVSAPYTVTTDIDTTYLTVSGEIPEEIESGGTLENIVIYPKSQSSGYYVSPTFSITMGETDITESCTRIGKNTEGYITDVHIDITEVTGDIAINVSPFPRCAITFTDNTSTYATITTAVDYTDINGDSETTTGFPSDAVCMYPGSKVKVHLSSESSVNLYFQSPTGTLLGEGTALDIEFTTAQAAPTAGSLVFEGQGAGNIGLIPSGGLSTMTASDFTVTEG